MYSTIRNDKLDPPLPVTRDNKPAKTTTKAPTEINPKPERIDWERNEPFYNIKWGDSLQK